MKKLALSVFICFGLISCGSDDQQIIVPTVMDNLQAEHNRIQKIFAEINPQEVITIVETIDADMDSALKLCQQSKSMLSPEDGTFFGRYQALRTGVKKFDTRYEIIKSELANTGIQLANLKASIQGKKLDPEAIKKHTITEKIALEKLTQAIEEMHASAVYVRANYSEYRPQFLEKLKALSNHKK